MEINIKEARGKISSLIDRVNSGDEIVILRRGKPVAKLVSVQKDEKRHSKMLPGLKDFRDSIRASGKPLSETVIAQRDSERY